MGQPLYRYQAPTGFPDRAEMWVNAGSLLHRMNYGITLASGRVKGVYFNAELLPFFQENREPESAEAALELFAAFLLPERDLEETLNALRPLINRPDLAIEIQSRADAAGGLIPDSLDVLSNDTDDKADTRLSSTEPPLAISQIIGLILGSPEFQRR